MDDHFPQHIDNSRRPRPQQQGDGQPENQRELEDERSGSAQSDRRAERPGEEEPRR